MGTFSNILKLSTILISFFAFSETYAESKLSRIDVFDPNLPFESVMPFDGDVAFVKMKGKWVLIDIEGRFLSKHDIDAVYSNTGDIFSVEKDGKMGFMNRRGELIIEYQYKNCFAACSFHNGLALINVGGRYGYINVKNKFVINPQFDDAYGFLKKGVAFVKINEKFGLINEKGVFLIPPKFDFVPMPSYIDLNDGLIPVRNYFTRDQKIETQDSYVDINGNVKFTLSDKFKFTIDGSGFHNGFAIIDELSSNGIKKRYINTDGKVVFDAYEEARSFHDGSASVKTNGRFGFIDKNGNFIINPQFDDADPFLENGLAIVAVGIKKFRKWGIINKFGEYVINPQFDFIIHGARDFYAVNVNEKWGIIDSSGIFVIKAEFSDAWVYSNGIATLHKNGRAGYQRIFTP
jgi:hypothetical protein